MKKLYSWWFNRTYKYVGIWEGDVLTGHAIYNYPYESKAK